MPLCCAGRAVPRRRPNGCNGLPLDSVEVPSNRMISVRVRGRTVIRPAVLTTASPQSDAGLAHTESLFAAAQYSWRAPLSARSFQAWRSTVPDKRDHVSILHPAGTDQVYRVETDTGAGVLRSASLTLRGEDLRPTGGTFQFAGEETVEIGEAAPPAPKIAAQPIPGHPEPAAEVPASPADTLRVLAALDEIGADVGDPIDVSMGAERVVVRATGFLSAERRQEIAAALRQLPRVTIDLDAASTPPQAAVRGGSLERYSTGMPDAMRRRLQDRLGGTAPLQEATDRVLDTSGLAVSRAHAVEFLAGKFPPQIEASLAAADREVLRTLQARHVAELQRLAAQIRADVNQLLPAPPTAAEQRAQAPWQTQARELVAAAQKLDESLNRLLAGSYSQASGEALLRDLPEQLERLSRAIRSQEGGK